MPLINLNIKNGIFIVSFVYLSLNFKVTSKKSPPS